MYHGLASNSLVYFSSLGKCMRKNEYERCFFFYFTRLGYDCEEHDNPADFLLDVINKCEGQTSANLGQ